MRRSRKNESKLEISLLQSVIAYNILKLLLSSIQEKQVTRDPERRGKEVQQSQWSLL